MSSFSGKTASLERRWNWSKTWVTIRNSKQWEHDPQSISTTQRYKLGPQLRRKRQNNNLRRKGNSSQLLTAFSNEGLHREVVVSFCPIPMNLGDEGGLKLGMKTPGTIRFPSMEISFLKQPHPKNS